MNDPAVLLVDEPTSALDHERGEEIMRLLTDVTRERSIGTVVVTHDMGILDHADRVLTMQDGTFVGSASSYGRLPTERSPSARVELVEQRRYAGG